MTARTPVTEPDIQRPPGKRRRPLPAARSAPRALDARTRPDLKRAAPATVIALLSYALGQRLGGIGRGTPANVDAFGVTAEVPAGYITLAVTVLAVIFVVAGLIASRAAARELARVAQARGGLAAASSIRLICHLLGFAVTGLGVLALLQVDLSGLLVGGAVTAVVLGIAAQQTLGNFFAGLVLLFARPYIPGQLVTIHSGAMGGPFEGVITGAGLTYTTIETSNGTISLPNSGLLAAGIGPNPHPRARRPTRLNPKAWHRKASVVGRSVSVLPPAGAAVVRVDADLLVAGDDDDNAGQDVLPVDAGDELVSCDGNGKSPSFCLCAFG